MPKVHKFILVPVAAAVAVTVALCAGPATARPRVPHSGGAHLVPANVIHGLTGSEMLAVGFVRDYTSQVGDPPRICPTRGRRGEILVAAPTGGTSTCTVKPGTPILILGMGNACSDVEPPPFHGDDAPAQTACTLAFLHDFVLEIHVSVDGGTPVDIRTDRFEFLSPQITVVLPEDNIFGEPAGKTVTLVAAGWLAALRGLTPGRHTIVSEVVSSAGPFTSTLNVNFLPGA
jgi:hypothetical protein